MQLVATDGVATYNVGLKPFDSADGIKAEVKRADCHKRLKRRDLFEACNAVIRVAEARTWRTAVQSHRAQSVSSTRGSVTP